MFNILIGGFLFFAFVGFVTFTCFAICGFFDKED